MQKDYVPNWHHELIAGRLESVALGKIKRLMIFMPPRHGKSELASIKFPAWYLGRNPDKEVVCCSHTAELAEGFGKQTRLTVSDELHEAIFPDCRLQKGSKKVGDWRVSDRGGFYSVGIGGALTGRGADLLIIDDPVKDRKDAESSIMRKDAWDWYTSTARTRLQSGGAIILIMTRFHDDDLAGKILEMEGEKGHHFDSKLGKWVKNVFGDGSGADKQGKWHVLRLPCEATEDELPYRRKGELLWPDRFGWDEVSDIKASSIRDWGALYQQDPVFEEGAEFQKEWFKQWKRVPGNLHYVTTVDLAISQKQWADDSVVMTVGMDTQDNIYVMEYKNWKANPDQVIKEIFKQQTEYNSMVGVETVGYQQALLHYIQIEGKKTGKYLHVTPIQTRSNKEEKIRGLVPYYSNGLIWHNNNSQELEDQLVRFPNAKHDDIIDALSMSLGMLKRPTVHKSTSLNMQYHSDGSPYLAG